MREKIFRILAIVLSACTFISLVVDNFVTGIIPIATNAHYFPENFTVWFDELLNYHRIYETMPWIPVTYFMVQVCFVLAGIIIVLMIIQAIFKNNYLNVIIQFISIISILVGITSLILLIVAVNKTNAMLISKYTLSFGAYALVFGIILGGISSLLSTYRVKIKIEKVNDYYCSSPLFK